MKNPGLKIVISPHAGYCFGVKRAMRLIEEGLEDPAIRLFSIGDVIHNPQAVERLSSRGVVPVDSMEELREGDTLVIRAHGVDPCILEEAGRRGVRVIDTTCPFVRRSQEYVERMHSEGTRVMIIGDPRHPEVIGIASRAGGSATIIGSPGEAMAVKGGKRAGVVIQTTFSREKALEIIRILEKRIPDLVVYDTICEATTKRQEATLDLAGEVDMVLVIGGRASSNTRKLYQMCLENGVKVRFIETADEIEDSWFEGISRVGLTTGTSTPEWVVEDVVRRLSSG